MKLLFLTLIFIQSATFAKENSESYVVTIHDTFVKVIGPRKAESRTSVIIENKTLAAHVLKLTDEYEDIKYIRVPPHRYRSIEFNYDPDVRYFLTSLSPPFQGIELLPGIDSYEVPPKQ